ncbi:UNVERIFIED_CONTAM: Phospholipase A1-Ibeta2, chloroplastic [Sesamum radiatum]|uniref:Phospholipase A1-Ibeta2, chloroplastic n=1 Tax=Sesamum radiatum TaxID=300843 RepID=A0AAW2L443_SESRA
MMQIGSTLPAHNLHLFRAKRANFQCSGSPLNPSNRSLIQKPDSLSTEITKKHLSNLDKLLQKQSKNPNAPDSDPALTKSTTDGENRARGILEGLNLSRVWPEMKAAEEMSPRHLNRLQRLLSKSSEYSPRNNLGSRWPTSREETQWPRHVALPDRSYRVTKSLYATASIGLPKWVDEVAPDLGWMTQRSSWIGYVAVCDDRREIQRMGRRDIVIALRGTATCLEWAENVRDLLVPLADENQESKEIDGQVLQPKVECGFLSLFKTRGAHVPSLAESVVEEVKRLKEKYKGETLSITITGHSLGAALALLVADELSTCAPDVPPLAVFSFGGPRVGNRAFANQLNSNNVKVLRIVNSQDVITRVPGMFVSEELDKKLRQTAVAGKLLNALDNNMPWAYAHVGTELRVDTKMSPFLKPNADVACCHDLEAYLHLVDGFLASNSPFRPNAKRSLWRLLNEQRSNVKRLYTSKAKALSLNNLEREMSMSTCLPSPS